MSELSAAVFFEVFKCTGHLAVHEYDVDRVQRLAQGLEALLAIVGHLRLERWPSVVSQHGRARKEGSGPTVTSQARVESMRLPTFWLITLSSTNSTRSPWNLSPPAPLVLLLLSEFGSGIVRSLNGGDCSPSTAGRRNRQLPVTTKTLEWSSTIDFGR